MADKETKKDSDFQESSKQDQFKKNELPDEDLNQVSGGLGDALLGRCGVCGKPKNECICPPSLG